MPHVPQDYEPRGRATEPRTDRLTKNTGVVVQAGVIVSTLLGGGIWFHNRLTVLEMDRAARDERDKYILQKLTDIGNRIDQRLSYHAPSPPGPTP